MNPQGPSEPNDNPPQALPPTISQDGQTPPYYYPPPAQPPSWPQPPPMQPMYGYGYPIYPKQVNGGLILVLGIMSLVTILLCGGFVGVILGPIAWVMGNNALRDIDAGLADPTQRSSVNGGRICGIVGTIVCGILVIISIVAIVIAMLSPGSSSSP